MEKTILYEARLFTFLPLLTFQGVSFCTPIVGAEKDPAEKTATEEINGNIILSNKAIENRLGRKLTLKEKIKRWRFKRSLKKAERKNAKSSSHLKTNKKLEARKKRTKAEKDDLNRTKSIQSFSLGIVFGSIGAGGIIIFGLFFLMLYAIGVLFAF